MDEAEAAVAAYGTKRVDFRFRGRTLTLALSHALFSSADVDTGTRLLLKELSRRWDEDAAAGRALPRSVLDAGCGVGVIGIAAAAALAAEGVRDLRVRAQDRDRLAAAFTTANARANGIGEETLAAYAEPLLSAPEGSHWDLILSNVPAKAGEPVLADFFARSARLLTEGGRVLVVVVNPLAAATRKWIAAAGAEVLTEATGPEHTVFGYGASASAGAAAAATEAAAEAEAADPRSAAYGAYRRTAGDFSLEGAPYRIEALHGVADFDEPSRAVALAAKLLLRVGWPRADRAGEEGPRAPAVLIHEADQGHFPAWLVARAAERGEAPPRLVLAARNVLSLAASAANAANAAAAGRGGLAAAAGGGAPQPPLEAVPVVDLGLSADRLRPSGPFDLVASFPEAVPRVDRARDAWQGAHELLGPGGLFLVAQASTEAERFDRAKDRRFSRVGDLKRDGFRALAYRKD